MEPTEEKIHELMDKLFALEKRWEELERERHLVRKNLGEHSEQIERIGALIFEPNRTEIEQYKKELGEKEEIIQGLEDTNAKLRTENHVLKNYRQEREDKLQKENIELKSKLHDVWKIVYALRRKIGVGEQP